MSQEPDAAREDERASVLQACPEQADADAGAPWRTRALLRLPGGGTLDLGRAPGEPTVINLWGSWCGPCREELPLMQQFADSLGGQ